MDNNVPAVIILILDILVGFFPEINHPAFGIPPFMESPGSFWCLVGNEGIIHNNYECL